MADLYITSRREDGHFAQAGQIDIRSNGAGTEIVGEVDVEVIEGNVVITVRRDDEAWFGPVSVVVR